MSPQFVFKIICLGPRFSRAVGGLTNFGLYEVTLVGLHLTSDAFLSACAEIGVINVSNVEIIEVAISEFRFIKLLPFNSSGWFRSYI